jgi:hypothetical protein
MINSQTYDRHHQNNLIVMITDRYLWQRINRMSKLVRPLLPLLYSYSYFLNPLVTIIGSQALALSSPQRLLVVNHRARWSVSTTFTLSCYFVIFV